MSLFLYNLLLPLAMLVYLPAFTIRMARRGGGWRHLVERFGIFTNTQRVALRQLHAPVWVHAVSVGEVVAALEFIRRWRERRPDLEVLLSVTTTTGHATAQARLPERVRLIYCPLDFHFTVRRVMRLVRPRLLVIFEVEIWPNLIAAAARAGIPVALANGRLSDRSARGYRRFAWFFRPLFRRFSLLCVQSDADAERLRAVAGGNAPVHVCNTMKFDQTPDQTRRDANATLDAVFGPGPRLVFTAGSTHAGEEEAVADAFLKLKPDFPRLKLVLVPRHHERAAQVEAMLRGRGLACRLLKPPPADSAPPAAGAPAPAADVLLVNTTGELMRFYGVADAAFVGKSFAGNHGGHNIIEPAIFAKPVLHGPNLENFRLVAEIFRRDHASIEVADADALANTLRSLLANPAEREAFGHRARTTVERHRGAIARTIDLLEPLIAP